MDGFTASPASSYLIAAKARAKHISAVLKRDGNVNPGDQWLPCRGGVSFFSFDTSSSSIGLKIPSYLYVGTSNSQPAKRLLSVSASAAVSLAVDSALMDSSRLSPS